MQNEVKQAEGHVDALSDWDQFKAEELAFEFAHEYLLEGRLDGVPIVVEAVEFFKPLTCTKTKTEFGAVFEMKF